jgi:hypothetical protein
MRKYRTEVSYLLLGTVIAIFASSMYMIYREGGSIMEILALLTGTLLMSLYLIFGISYEISEHNILKVRAGFFYKINVPIDKIHTIEKTNSILSAPASSLNRIELKYNKFDSVVISPQHREMFIQELLNINPNINVKL